MTTTIPFDKGWQVLVDGEQVETFELANALVGYYIEDAGEHEVQMIYCPKELVLGTAISIVSVIGFFLLIIFEKKLRRINGYGEFFGIPEPVPALPVESGQAEMTDQTDPSETAPDQTDPNTPTE